MCNCTHVQYTQNYTLHFTLRLRLPLHCRKLKVQTSIFLVSTMPTEANFQIAFRIPSASDARFHQKL